MDESQARRVLKVLHDLSERRYTGFVQFFLKDGGLQREVLQQERVVMQ